MELWSKNDVITPVRELSELCRRRFVLNGQSHEMRINQLVDFFVDQKNLVAVSELRNGLFHSNNRIRNASVMGLERLLCLVPVTELQPFGDFINQSCFCTQGIPNLWPKPTFLCSWCQLDGKKSRRLLEKFDSVWVANLFSLHRNGRVREAAVNYLGAQRTGQELPFLIFRQNDWVHKIAKLAQKYISIRWHNEYLHHFAKQTHLLYQSLRWRRQDLSVNFDEFISLLTKSENRRQLPQAFASVDRKIKRHLLKMLLEREGNHKAECVRIGLEAKDFVTCCMSLQHVDRLLEKEECFEIAHRFIKHKIFRIREQAYNLMARLLPNDPATVWAAAAFDKNQTIRSTAIFFLNQGGVDVAKMYREHLDRNPNSKAALSGLIQCGSASDISRVQAYLDSPFPCLRVEAIWGIVRFGNELTKKLLLSLLVDPSPKVVKTAFQVLLQSNSTVIEKEILFQYAAKCQTPVQIESVLRLSLKHGRWNVMSHLIETAGSSHSILREHANQCVENALSKKGNFTQPTKTQKHAIQTALDNCNHKLSEAVAYELKRFGFDVRFNQALRTNQ